MIMDIGIVGLGHMGAAIARNLLGAGHQVTVWNRNPYKAAALVDAGAVQAATPADAAAGDFVITMLADDRAVEAVVWGKGGLLSSPGRAVHVSMSTIGTAFASRLAVVHELVDRAFVSAPVFGRPAAALAGELFIVAAGEPEALAVCEPLFDAMGQRTFIVGHAPQKANLVKLCGNFVMLAAVEALGEAMTLAARGGVARSTLLDVLTRSQFDTFVYRNYGKMLVEKRFHPAGFAAPMALKDMGLVGEAAGTVRLPMPVLGILRDHLITAIAREGDDVDCTAIGDVIEAVASLEGRDLNGARALATPSAREAA